MVTLLRDSGVGMPKQPYVVVEGKRATAYYIGIIDFLQGWTGGKKCAHIIKVIFAPKPVRPCGGEMMRNG